MPRAIPTHRPRNAPTSAIARAAYERQAPRRGDIAWYQSPAWRGTRAAKLRRDPLCQRCLKEGRVKPATMVHHVEERKARPDLALDLDNLESLCGPCHSRHHKSKKAVS